MRTDLEHGEIAGILYEFPILNSEFSIAMTQGFAPCCAPVFAAGLAAGVGTVHSGQPITTSFLVSLSFARRSAISASNCSSVSATRIPRSMNMFATERFPEPCQLRGSGMFLFADVLSM